MPKEAGSTRRAQHRTMVTNVQDPLRSDSKFQIYLRCRNGVLDLLGNQRYLLFLSTQPVTAGLCMALRTEKAVCLLSLPGGRRHQVN